MLQNIDGSTDYLIEFVFVQAVIDETIGEFVGGPFDGSFAVRDVRHFGSGNDLWRSKIGFSAGDKNKVGGLSRSVAARIGGPYSIDIFGCRFEVG